MTTKQPFFPHYGANQVLTAGSTAAPFPLQSGGKQLRVVNTGASKGYFRTYNSQNTPAPQASAADYCVPAGTGCVVTRIGHDTISVFSAGGTTLEVMPGEGF
jgi:hypothetical protein